MPEVPTDCLITLVFSIFSRLRRHEVAMRKAPHAVIFLRPKTESAELLQASTHVSLTGRADRNG